EPAPPSWEQQQTAAPQTWEQQRSIGSSWEQPAPTPAPQSWDQLAAAPQWTQPEPDIREDLAAALDARMAAPQAEPAVEPEVVPEVSPDPSPVELPSAHDERLAALSGVLGPAPAEPEMAPPEIAPAAPPVQDRISEWSRVTPAVDVEAEAVPEEKKKGR